MTTMKAPRILRWIRNLAFTTAALTTSTALAQEVNLDNAPTVTETHVVRSGDTLWDLCAKYLNSPWYWPKIWSYNPQLTNPHWLYPGNALRFYPSDENLPTEISANTTLDAPVDTTLRDDDLVRTVGWFTTVFPLRLTLPQTDVGERLRSVKEQVRQVPRNGIGYGLLRYLGDDPGVKTRLEAQPQPDILFNYLGDLAGLVPPGSMFQLARGLRLSRSPKGQRHYLLEVNAAVVKGQLQVEWTYGRQHQRDTVQGWADGMMQGVRSQITHYLSPESKQDTTLTPVDFPLANLDRQKLGKIAALLNRSGSQSGSQSDSGG